MGRSTIAVIWIFLGLFVVAGIYVYSREGHLRDERTEFAATPPPVTFNPATPIEPPPPVTLNHVAPPTHSPAAPERTPAESSLIDFGDDAHLLANNGVCNDQRFVGRTGMGGMGIGSNQTMGHDATDCRRAFERGVVRFSETLLHLSLTPEELLGLSQQIARCWSRLAAPVLLETLVVTLRLRLSRDGSLAGVPEVVDYTGWVRDPSYRAVAESARRAVIQCAPYSLPPDRYDAWKEIVIDFDLSDNAGGQD